MRPTLLGSRLLAVAVALAALAGCASVPTSFSAVVPTTGPIEQGEQVGVDPEDQFIRVIARGPREGMSATEIVQGFLDASASFDGNHAVARQFLTRTASATWDTNAGVQVYEATSTLSEFGRSVVMTAPQTGTIATNGRYEVAGPSAELRERFQLTLVDGEWRIDEVPQGLLLAQSDVDRAFRSFAVYFFNPSFDTLVPDPRMIPVVGSGLATTLVRRLVAGPSEWLLPAVRTGFPDGVRLNIDSVPIESGIARVDLTANARAADDETRQALSQQIVWTLRQLPDVQAVEITAGGQPLLVPGAPSPQPRDAWPLVDPNGLPPGASGYVARIDGVVRLIPEGARPVAGDAGAGDIALVDIAVSNDSTSIAGIDIEGAVWKGRMVEGAPLIRIREPGSPTGLAFDRSTSVWLVDATEGLISVAGDGAFEKITVEGLSRRTSLIAAIPSRDGTRAALIVRRGPRTVLLLARIVRSSGRATSILVDGPIRVESNLVEVIDVAWSGADSLSVLGSESPGSVQVFDVDIATGVSAARGTPEGPVSVGAAPGLPTLIGSADGLVYGYVTGSWQERVRGLSPTYPG
ncbi:MAG: LpqB family beta-propeller domain-containing protein [Actinomycetota bacterium]|nr:LpqB family beta-propeller domain-containing protein [Actinomycetota bacterium]